MLVNCVVYKEGRKVADIDKRQISDYLKQPGVFVWVAMKDPSDEEVLALLESGWSRTPPRRQEPALT